MYSHYRSSSHVGLSGASLVGKTKCGVVVVYHWVKNCFMQVVHVISAFVVAQLTDNVSDVATSLLLVPICFRTTENKV